MKKKKIVCHGTFKKKYQFSMTLQSGWCDPYKRKKYETSQASAMILVSQCWGEKNC